MTTLLVGLVSDVGETYVVVGKTRIELRDGQALAPYQVGFSVAIMADAVDGRICGRHSGSPARLSGQRPRSSPAEARGDRLGSTPNVP